MAKKKNQNQNQKNDKASSTPKNPEPDELKVHHPPPESILQLEQKAAAVPPSITTIPTTMSTSMPTTATVPTTIPLFELKTRSQELLDELQALAGKLVPYTAKDNSTPPSHHKVGSERQLSYLQERHQELCQHVRQGIVQRNASLEDMEKRWEARTAELMRAGRPGEWTPEEVVDRVEAKAEFGRQIQHLEAAEEVLQRCAPALTRATELLGTVFGR